MCPFLTPVIVVHLSTLYDSKDAFQIICSLHYAVKTALDSELLYILVKLKS